MESRKKKRNKPQITQISQMTETGEIGYGDSADALRTPRLWFLVRNASRFTSSPRGKLGNLTTAAAS